MKTVIITCLMLYAFVGFAQNLVPNPSFEEYSLCPDNFSQINYTNNWYNPSNNMIYSGSPDFFSSCSSSFVSVPMNFIGSEFAKTGNSYAGIFVYCPGCGVSDSREYLQIKLSNTLEANKKYCVEFYASLADSSVWVSDHLGIYFSTDTIHQDTIPNTIIQVIPQIITSSLSQLNIKTGWALISGEYFAQGEENFLTIGHFKPDSQSNFQFIQGGDTISQTSFNSSYYFIDDVKVFPCPNQNLNENIKNSSLKIVQLPHQHLIKIIVPKPDNYSCHIYDLTGKLIESQSYPNTDVLEFSILNLANGQYFIDVVGNEAKFNSLFIIN